MKISKRELIAKIVRAHSVVEKCLKEYGGSKYPYLTGAYEAIFCELLGDSHEELLALLGDSDDV